MTLHHEARRAPVWVTLALLTVGCGDSSFSPASPSRISGSTTGAVISGTVTGLTAQVAPSTQATTLATTKPVTVTVVGTGISSVIDNNSGRFQLNDVPTGDVTLRFTGSGLDATLTVRDVRAGDRIDIKVRLTDTSVRIDAERRDRNGIRGGDDDDEDDDGDGVEGVVSGLAGTCPNISFMVRTTMVRANDATRYEDGSCSRVRNDRRVEVHGVRQLFDGAIQATRIEIDD